MGQDRTNSSRSNNRRRAGRPWTDRTFFPIVGIGASAGGLDAFTQLLKALPADTGMAFIFIQHLDPVHPSLLSQALGKATSMQVAQVQNGMRVQPGHVYVIPPDADVALAGAELVLVKRAPPSKPHLPVDSFFRSLAQERGCQAIGVVLSGTASDGTAGLRAIKGEHGITLVQDPQSAKFSGMPQSAIDAGVVDYTLPIPLLAEELVRLSKHPYVAVAPELPPDQVDQDALNQIFLVVREAIGVDYTEYKPATLQRRLARRMAVRKTKSLGDYLHLLRDDPQEARLLHEDILIHVTSFFRDPEAFEALRKRVFPELLRPSPEGEPIRIWVAGCSTGEEVYSLAIALLEFLDGAPCPRPLQIFGSDISEQAIRTARQGLYPDSVVRELSEERRRRFFVKADGGYRIHKTVRELCVFVRHDLARDPPFLKLNLIACRNVLIYFAAALQKRIVATFHYCLSQPGYLVLGRTEGAVGFGHFFSPVDKANKIFVRTTIPSRLRFAAPARGQSIAGQPLDRVSLEQHRSTVDVTRHVDRLLLAKYAPAGLIVNDAMDVLQFRGHTGSYLEPAAGEPQNNVLKMARPGLLSALRDAFAQAKKEMAPVRKHSVAIGDDGSTRTCDVVVIPITAFAGAKEPLYVVLFEDSVRAEKLSSDRAPRPARAAGLQDPSRVRHELAATKEYLQSLIEEHARTNDDLGSANEELVSSNEELQSMNEELETAKEELQSANEELITVNDELHSRNQELHQVNADLVNLLDTVDLPVVILDVNRRIRRFTPKARSLMNLLPSDLGRPIDDIKSNVDVTDLDQRIAESVATGSLKESEVQDREGRFYRMQIRPYRTADNRIDGAIVSLVDIDVLKHDVRDAEWARDYAAGIVEAVQVPLVVLDEQLRAVSANAAFYLEFRVNPETTEGKTPFEWDGGAWDIPAIRSVLEGLSFAPASGFQGHEVELDFASRKRWLSLSARTVQSRLGVPMVLLAIEDITQRKQAEAERAALLVEARAATEQAERANLAKDDFLATLSHELRTPLGTMLMHAQMMRRGDLDGERIKRGSEAIERCVKTQSQLIDDLLDSSRIVTGKFKMDMEAVDLGAVTRAAIETISGQAERKSVAIEADVDRPVGRVSGDRTRLQQVLWNLLANAVKFTPAHGRVSVSLERAGTRAVIEVRDTGSGIDPAFLPKVFNRFTQEDSTTSRRYGGLGLGLAIVKHIVESHGGTVQAASEGKGRGAAFQVSLPLLPVEDQTVLARVPGAPESGSAPDDAALRGLRALVIDDDLAAGAAVQEILRQAGAEASVVTSAEQARRAVAELHPQVIVCDIAMPGENGYNFIRHLRESAPAGDAQVPAIALTALAGDDDRRRSFAAGFQQHLSKPVDIDRLVETVSALTAKQLRPGLSERH
jgi:two-component system, chemotaxis family, CheB/CheR fusion protein